MSNLNSYEFFKLDSTGASIRSFPAIIIAASFQLLNSDLTAGCMDETVSIPCEGPWRTQTQGGWGAPANGNNPGVYRDTNFAAAFPDGLTMGCADGNTLTLPDAAAVESFLPSGGSPASLPTGDGVYTGADSGGGNGIRNGNGNGGGANTAYGSFAGNLTALALSLGFDA